MGKVLKSRVMRVVGGMFVHDFPSRLYGIEVGGIGGKIMQFYPWMQRNKIPHGLAMLIATSVEDDMNYA